MSSIFTCSPHEGTATTEWNCETFKNRERMFWLLESIGASTFSMIYIEWGLKVSPHVITFAILFIFCCNSILLMMFSSSPSWKWFSLSKSSIEWQIENWIMQIGYFNCKFIIITWKIFISELISMLIGDNFQSLLFWACRRLLSSTLLTLR
jgi:hypothetical protein